MKIDAGESHLLSSGIDGRVMESKGNQVLLGVTTDPSLAFDKHFNNLL